MTLTGWTSPPYRRNFGREPRRWLTHHTPCTARKLTIPGLAGPGDASCKRAHTFISLRDQTHARRGMHGSTGMHGEEQSASEMYRSMRGQRAGRSWPTACLALLGWSPRSVRCAARRADGASSPRGMVAAFGSLARQGGPTARTVRCAARRGRMRAEALSCSPAAPPLAGGHPCRQHAWMAWPRSRPVRLSRAIRFGKPLLFDVSSRNVTEALRFPQPACRAVPCRGSRGNRPISPANAETNTEYEAEPITGDRRACDRPRD